MLINDDDREDFDEAQGLTIDMISDELTRQGWTTGAIASLEVMPSPGGLRWIAKCKGITLQALLRQLNQRMRKGCPSDAARRKHDGFWLMRLPYSPPTVVKWNESQAGWQAQQVNCNDVVSFDDAAHCFFWPCDAEANKVRWPTDDNGNML